MTCCDLDFYTQKYCLSMDERRRLERATQLFIDDEGDVLSFIYNLLQERNQLELSGECAFPANQMVKP